MDDKIHIAADVAALGQLDEGLDHMLAQVKKERPTTPALADWIINPPEDWDEERMPQHWAMISLLFATALQRLAADV